MEFGGSGISHHWGNRNETVSSCYFGRGEVECRNKIIVFKKKILGNTSGALEYWIDG
jgi:hypothetical protein